VILTGRSAPLLPDRLSLLGPNVIGATGGSGTRVFARLVSSKGMFIGNDVNDSEDAISFGAFSDRWINVWLRHRSRPLPAHLDVRMRQELEQILATHLEGMRPICRWGWKEPRSIFLLRFFDRNLPSLRFLHVIRDGRDMAFSSNQNQLLKHGQAFGITSEGPTASIALWNSLNVETARYGEKVLGARYLRLRFEDLCAEPARTAERVVDFFELTDSDPSNVTPDVVSPDTIGRWRRQDPELVLELERIAAPALERFGYI
jgi:hypothetical protein